MFVGGTTSKSDWVENFTKIKTGGIQDMARYKEARRVLMENPQVAVRAQRGRQCCFRTE